MHVTVSSYGAVELDDLVWNPTQLNAVGTVATLFVSPLLSLNGNKNTLDAIIYLYYHFEILLPPFFMSVAMFLSLEYQAFTACPIYAGSRDLLWPMKS